MRIPNSSVWLQPDGVKRPDEHSPVSWTCLLIPRQASGHSLWISSTKADTQRTENFCLQDCQTSAWQTLRSHTKHGYIKLPCQRKDWFAQNRHLCINKLHSASAPAVPPICLHTALQNENVFMCPNHYEIDRTLTVGSTRARSSHWAETQPLSRPEPLSQFYQHSLCVQGLAVTQKSWCQNAAPLRACCLS